MISKEKLIELGWEDITSPGDIGDNYKFEITTTYQMRISDGNFKIYKSDKLQENDLIADINIAGLYQQEVEDEAIAEMKWLKIPLNYKD